MPEENKPDEKPQEPTSTRPIENDSSILSEVAGSMPEVVPDALAAAQEKQNEINKVQADFKDAKGRPFNPDIHDADPISGQPKMTPSGRFKMKSRPTLKRDGVNLPPVTSEAEFDQKIKVAAVQYAQMFVVFGVSIFGEEWKPKKENGVDEMKMLIDANESYMVENGYVAPPAWMALAMAYGAYAGTRFFMPVTKSKIQVIWEKTKTASINLWLKLTGKIYEIKERKS